MTSTSVALSRRHFLKLSAMAASTGLLAACIAPGAAPTQSGTGAAQEAVNVVVWYQDWDGANRIMDKAKADARAPRGGVGGYVSWSLSRLLFVRDSSTLASGAGLSNRFALGFQHLLRRAGDGL